MAAVGHHTTGNDPSFLNNFEEDFDTQEADDADESVDPYFTDLLSKDDGDKPDLYAVLGVPKDSTLEDIRRAYKKLSLLLHPDRHVKITEGDDSVETSRVIQADAETAFGRVCAAYNILSDQNKRSIYDTFGHEGLNIDGWSVVTTQKSDPELRLEYLMLKQKMEADKQLQLTQPSSDFSLGIDLTDLFDRYLKEPPEDRYRSPTPQINHLTLAQSVTAGVTLKDMVNLTGQVTAHNGLGIGSCSMLWRHYRGKSSWLSYTTVDSELSYGRGGRGPSVGLRARRAFGDRHVGYFGTQLAVGRGRNSTGQRLLSMVPGASLGWQMQLLPRTVARIEWRWNMDGGLNSEVSWSSVDEKYTARLSASMSVLGRMGVAVRMERSVPWSWLNFPHQKTSDQSREAQTVPEWAQIEEEIEPQRTKEGRIFGTLDVNTLDLVELTVGANCAISNVSSLMGSFSFSFWRGVNLKLSLQRGSQTYSFPIILSEESNLVAAGYGVVVPIFIFAVVRTLIYEPYLNKQLERAQIARRKKLKTELANRQREALSTQALMRHSAKRIREVESTMSGLLIEQAVYGLLPSSESQNHKLQDISGPVNFDVTIPIQALVDRSQLRLPPGRWSDLQGFYDPCLGIVKSPVPAEALRQLRVTYLFRGELHEIITSETQGLAIPMTKHKLTS